MPALQRQNVVRICGHPFGCDTEAIARCLSCAQRKGPGIWLCSAHVDHHVLTCRFRDHAVVLQGERVEGAAEPVIWYPWGQPRLRKRRKTLQNRGG